MVAAEPLFQTNFFPDFIQVNLLPETTSDFPSVGQVAPCLAAALASIGIAEVKKSTAANNIRFFFIFEMVPTLISFVCIQKITIVVAKSTLPRKLSVD